MNIKKQLYNVFTIYYLYILNSKFYGIMKERSNEIPLIKFYIYYLIKRNN